MPRCWWYVCSVSTNSYPPLSHKLRTTVRDLQRAANRDEARQFIVEGVRACEALSATTLLPDLIVVRHDADIRASRVAASMALQGVEVVTASTRDMELMCDAVTPQDLLAVVPFPAERPLGDRVVMLDGVRDPGNAGTIVRTAAWFGFSDVVFLDGCVDPFHTKVIRSTVGSLAHVNIIRDATVEAIRTAWNDRGAVIASVVSGGASPDAVHTSGSAVMVLVGGEADGLSDQAMAMATQRVTIPGNSDVESLNAAIAAAILCYAFRAANAAGDV